MVNLNRYMFQLYETAIVRLHDSEMQKKNQQQKFTAAILLLLRICVNVTFWKLLTNLLYKPY